LIAFPLLVTYEVLTSGICWRNQALSLKTLPKALECNRDFAPIDFR